MSTAAPRVLPFGAALARVARLHARVALRPRRLALPIAVGVSLALGGLVARVAGERPITSFDFLVRWGALGVYPALCGLLLAGAAWGLEVEGRTLTYLLLRPVRRPVLVVGKLAAVALVLAALETVTISLLYAATWGGALGDGLPHLQRALAAGALGAVGFTALLGAMGVAFGARAFTAGATYLLAIEFAAGTLGTGARHLSIAYHLRTVAGLSETTGGVGPAVSAVLVLAYSAAWLGLAMLLAAKREHEHGSGSE